MNPTRAAATREGAEPALSALAFFFVLTSYYIVRPVRDQLSGAVGSSQLPLFYAATFVAMLLLTPVFGAMVARFPRRRLLGWSYSFFIACLLAFVPAFLAQAQIGARLLGVVFFVWVSVFNLFVVSLFWSFMADIFDSARARHIFPLIALGGMAGAVFGPAVTSLLVGLLGVAPLLVVSALMLGMALVLLLRLSVRNSAGGTHGEDAIGGSLWAGVRELWSRPFLRYMAILMVLGDGIGTLAYALVADYAKAHFVTSAARTAFYAHMDLAVNILGAMLQLTLTRWLLIRRGAGWGLVLPALVNVALLLMVMLGGHATLSMLGAAVTPLVAVMMVMSRGFAYGMTKPAVDALYTRVPRETRYKGKNFVETAVWRFGDLLVTSGVSGLGKLGVGVAGMALIGAMVSSASVWVAQRAGHSPDLLPEDRPLPPGPAAASRTT
ncbi:NTP/NDP exchange transporter [Rhodanobacter aciditrophus]|uniref:NTP/NDP exchange transporter n=1 Tax=Rhodanobacter aciditrophus TaxID=1623218 RepID=UPI003CF652EA